MPTFLAILVTMSLHGHVQLDYTLRIDQADLSAFDVTMRIRSAPDTFTIAYAAHAEYDNKYWRYIENLTVADGRAVRIDSVLWKVLSKGGDVTVRYRVRPPVVEGLRAAWKSFLAPTGGLVGGPDAFLYVVGAEDAPSTVKLDLPAGWQTATGLSITADARRFTATNVDTLMDSPILVGQLRDWTFQAGGVPHRIVYWGLPTGTAFDTTAFRDGIERLARAAVSFWGKTPYRNYTFTFQDGAYGGLEHANSVTLGAASADLAKNPNAYLRETAHEFVHTWNLMQIRPAEYRFVDYKPQRPVASLWFSEGLTIYYADLLTRRAGLRVEDARDQRLASLITTFLNNPGYVQYSAEAISRVSYNERAGALGNFDGSPHQLGELIGLMLDLMIREATDGARSMDDVMRLMLARSETRPGYVGADVEAAIETVCSCNVTPFFDAHVRGAGTIDFNRYLASHGLRAVIGRKPAINRDSTPAADMWIRGSQSGPDQPLRIFIWNPATVWARSGLLTNDVLVAINGTRFANWAAMRNLLGALRIGDSARVEILRDGTPMTIVVPITGYDIPDVRIETVPNARPRQIRLREAWRAGR
jgi:predicted metalloprotease with PDZ domain